MKQVFRHMNRMTEYSLMEACLVRFNFVFASRVEEADRLIDECSACLLREVVVSEAQAKDHNRSILDAKKAILT